VLANQAWSQADKAFEIANAVNAVQLAIVKGLIAAGVVDGRNMSEFLTAQLRALTPAEKGQAYGQVLSAFVAALDEETKPRH
jgi:hypothetical protein